MSNAKKCDICGKYYDVIDMSEYMLDYERHINMVRLHRAMKPDEKRYDHDDHWFHFDACDECLQDVLDYILSKKAVSNYFTQDIKGENS